ncbi:MAG: hypothetical protein SFW36_14145 [Leptolyngbyaceae cyanobacterium bins.59]|nr:hypothetical protein [Leptolyngbyaceae cyanobacterium bins.59]
MSTDINLEGSGDRGAPLVNSSWLKRAEQVAIVGSIAGIVATEVTKQLVFTSAPLSMALLLNVLNRRRQDEMTRERSGMDVARLRQDFYQLDINVWKDVSVIKQQLLALPTPPESNAANFEEAVQSIRTQVEAQLDEKIATLSSVDLTPIQDEMANLQAELGYLSTHLNSAIDPANLNLTPLQDQIDQLKQQLESSTLFIDVSYLEQQLEELRATTALLEQRSAGTTSPDLTALEQQVGEFWEVIEQIAHKVDQISPNFDATALERQLEEVRGSVARLEQRANEQVAIDVVGMEEQLYQMRSAITHLEQQHQNSVMSFAPEVLDQRFGNLEAAIERLEVRTVEFSAPDPLVFDQRLEELQATILQLEEKANQPLISPVLDQRLEELQTSILHLEEKTNQPSVSQIDETLEQRFQELHTTILQLEQRLNESPAAEPPEVWVQQFNELQTTIAHLEEKVSENHTPLTGELLEQRLAELRNAIVHLEEKTEQSLADQNVQLLFSEMRGLYQRQDTMEQQIIRAVRSEMQSHLSVLADAGFNSIHAGLAELRTEVREELSQLQSNLQNTSPPTVDLTPIQEQITHLHQRFESLPTPFDATPLEHRLDELKAVITRLEAEAEQSPLKNDLTVFFSAMRNLAQQQNGAN